MSAELKTLSQLRMCVEKTLYSENYIYEGLNDLEEKGYGQLKAAFLKSKIWKAGSTISISFLENPGPEIHWTELETIKATGAQLDPIEISVRNLKDPKEAIKKVVEERIKLLVKDHLTLNFIENNGDVRIGFNPNGGCWSLLGKDHLGEDKKERTMNFGWLDVGTIIHEFGHMLGLIHEHQNPFGKPIPWDEAKVYKWAKIVQGWDKETAYKNIIQKYEASQLNGSEFDPKSIMLYFFPGQLTLTGVGTNANYRLSYYDVEYILKIYSNDEDIEKFLRIIYPNNKQYQSIITEWENLRTKSSTQFYKNPIFIFITIIVILVGLLLFFLLKKKK